MLREAAAALCLRLRASGRGGHGDRRVLQGRRSHRPGDSGAAAEDRHPIVTRFAEQRRGDVLDFWFEVA
jgi:hypothetical protein